MLAEIYPLFCDHITKLKINPATTAQDIIMFEEDDCEEASLPVTP